MLVAITDARVKRIRNVELQIESICSVIDDRTRERPRWNLVILSDLEDTLHAEFYVDF